MKLHPPHLASMLLLILSVALLPRQRAAAAVPDDPFEQEYRDAFITGGDEANDIRAIAVDGQDRVWIATAAGAFVLADGTWQAPAGEAIGGPAYDLLVGPDDVLWIGAWNGCYECRDGALRRLSNSDMPVRSLAHDGKHLLTGGPDGVRLRDGDRWRDVPIECATSIRALVAEGNTIWAATRVGLFRYDGEATRCYSQPDEVLSSEVTALARDRQGRLWVGSTGGIDVYDGERRVAQYTGQEGLPNVVVASLDFDREGTLWVGTELGVARFDGQRWSLRHSLRWLPSDAVRGVAFGADGTAWVGTAGGISPLRSKTLTLEEKAAHYQEIVRARHVREPGLVERCFLETPGDLSSFRPMDTDNDGLFTGLYLAAESYRYAATRDPAARRNAREAFRGMQFLQTVTETPGFVARTVIPSDWTRMADANRTYTAQEIVEILVDDPRWKRVETRWRKSNDGRWLWKGDTSSDEITGHYFAYAVYYDLAADDEDRSRVRDLVRRITDYLIDGGYVLRDIDGQATRWGVWSPERLNGDPNWRLDRGVNSVEMLSFLRVAHHMTGDERYESATSELIEQHGYGENVLDAQQFDPGAFTYIDSQLLALAYPALFRYEDDPQRLELYRRSARRWFAPVQEDHSPLYTFVYAAALGEPVALQGSVEFLRDVPLDMIEWTIDNTQREDVQMVRRPTIDRWQTDRLLPASERAIGKWDKNPYAAHAGAGGRTESSTVYWLLPYWMGRYHGFISPPSSE